MEHREMKLHSKKTACGKAMQSMIWLRLWSTIGSVQDIEDLGQDEQRLLDFSVLCDRGTN